jgi:hypothetical protein
MENLDDRYDPDRWMASGKTCATSILAGGKRNYITQHIQNLANVLRDGAPSRLRKFLKAWKELNTRVSDEELREVWRSIT